MKINMNINMKTKSETKETKPKHEPKPKPFSAVGKAYASSKTKIVTGSALTAFFGLGLIGFFSKYKSSDLGTAIFTLVLLLLSLFILYSGLKQKKLLKFFRSYVTIISADSTGSMEIIAANTGSSVDKVKMNLQEMIKKNYFTNAYIDFERNRIVTSRQQSAGEYQPEYHCDAKPDLVRVSCKGCGAVSTIPAGSDAECEYCGSKLL